MSGWVEQTFVVGLVVSAAAYLAYRGWRLARGKGGSCGSCSTCPTVGNQAGSQPLLSIQPQEKEMRRESASRR